MAVGWYYKTLRTHNTLHTRTPSLEDLGNVQPVAAVDHVTSAARSGEMQKKGVERLMDVTEVKVLTDSVQHAGSFFLFICIEI